MKSPNQALAELAVRLQRMWSQVLGDGVAWKGDVQLDSSNLVGQRLIMMWPVAQGEALAWEDWLADAGPGPVLQRRRVQIHGSEQFLPAMLRVADIDTAARLVGNGWPERLHRARSRMLRVHDLFGQHPELAAVVRSTIGWDDADFDLLCRSARWFADRPVTGLTARQVPVEGMGTKWLARHEALVRRVAGLEDLGLVAGRPSRIHFTYLDPNHLAAGGRRHDMATVGDVDAVAYAPRVVVISENRDTAQLFHPVEGGIALEGDGRGAGAVATLRWVRDAPDLWYWGDMDADGLEILHGFRTAGLPVRSLLMDLEAYRRWERFGVDRDERGQPLRPREPRDVTLLEPGERELYLALCSAEWTGHRRIEQERIPLAEAAAVVRRSPGAT